VDQLHCFESYRQKTTACLNYLGILNIWMGILKEDEAFCIIDEVKRRKINT
jgi:spore maturation protein SpmA